MKKVIIISICLLVSITSFADDWPGDIPTIEALIDAHKGQQNGLKTRRSKEIANAELIRKVKDLSTEYEAIKKKAAEKIVLGYNTIEFAGQLTDITLRLYKATPLMEEYVRFMLENGIQHPLILKYYYASYKGIESEISRCAKVLAAGVVLPGNKQQKYSQLMEISAGITYITYAMTRTLFLCKGIVSMNLGYSKSFEEMMKDKAFVDACKKKAEKIVQDFSK
ncbi:hypothetical protein FACS189451_03740 [Bacteroidia bacterium]|nr:hypothetical protein FACS189446_1540 [Bacteroidia bacterium]GHT61534.1 hypothetical protein FACS189451_03740 [Bacteroidia bacterium]